MTPRRGNAFLFRSSQQLPRLRLRPLKGFLIWHGALQGPSTRLVRSEIQRNKDVRCAALDADPGRHQQQMTQTLILLVKKALLHNLSLIVKSQQNRIELVIRPAHGLWLMERLIISLISGRIIGLFRLSYLTPGLMAAGVTEVIVEKEQEQQTKKAISPVVEKEIEVTSKKSSPSPNNKSAGGSKKQDASQRSGKGRDDSSKKKWIRVSSTQPVWKKVTSQFVHVPFAYHLLRSHQMSFQNHASP